MCYDTYIGEFEDVFKRKLRTGDVEDWLGLGQSKWIYDDFDPAYGLEGEEADSIMDWVREIFPPFALSHILTRIIVRCVCVRVHRSGG